MGIKQLSVILKEHCKKGVKEKQVGSFAFKKVAIDISNFIYQFLIAVRSGGSALGYGDTTTSHLVGMFYRTIRIVESGVTPIFVFDGKPPELKLYELKKRSDRRDKAEEQLKLAMEAEDKAEIEKQTKRKIKVSEEHVNDCKRLLKLMGIPYLTAPSEAEAFCAYLCKVKCVDAVATEDMDALPFGAPVLLRGFSSAAVKKTHVTEYNLQTCLGELDMNLPEFIDLCILLGCDYTESGKGIGPKKGVSLIKKYRCIEKIFEHEKMEVSPNFEYQKAREIFNELSNIPVETNVSEFTIKWDDINLEEVKKFLVTEKAFDENRVINGIKLLKSCRNKSKQTSLDKFLRKK